MMSISDEQLAQALRKYVSNRWSGVDFACFLSISQPQAHNILSGKARTSVKRPDGFQYPWPDVAKSHAVSGENHGRSRLTEADILDVFKRIEQGEFQSMQEVQAALGVAKGAASEIVSGVKWSHLPRSAKMKAQIATIMQRQVLSQDIQDAIIKDLLAGTNRNDVKNKYNLTDTKIRFYVTKVNKMKST